MKRAALVAFLLAIAVISFAQPELDYPGFYSSIQEGQASVQQPGNDPDAFYIQAGSCNGLCTGQGTGSCYCDSLCEEIGDCCADYNPAACQLAAADKPEGTEAKQCGVYYTVAACGYDDLCEEYEDCCADYNQICGGTAYKEGLTAQAQPKYPQDFVEVADKCYKSPPTSVNILGNDIPLGDPKLYILGTLFAECVPCSQASGCSYKNEFTCKQDQCGFGNCLWENNNCISKEKSQQIFGTKCSGVWGSCKKAAACPNPWDKKFSNCASNEVCCPNTA